MDDPNRPIIERQMRGEQVAELYAKAEELDSTITELVDGAAAMAERAASLAEKGEIYRNLDASSRAEAVGRARAVGLLEGADPAGVSAQ